MIRTRTLKIVGLAAVATLVVAGCSSDDNDEANEGTDGGVESSESTENDAENATGADESASEATGEEAEEETGDAPDDDAAALEQAVRDYTTALFAPDADTGYALLSERCKSAMSAEGFSLLAEQSAEVYGALEVETFNVDEIDGDSALVTYGVGVPSLDVAAQSWSREGESWLWDGC
ncbi:hypothetical protein RM844_06215 [Streptomyces sp. DSM 44915]|uniref:Lipoprotein n=1 Tax=Streptomyces chisholmiae TaxID=3075540 RepID=A0ABU2JNS5_9ACTN|nr:hypothetical protein [Streptomyces sp. DSM 44915]MDT0265883.1 hypothetical protein [Streptomyces sp. DSM 44915]